MQLPNLPRTRQAVAYRAKREGWHVTVKKGIGAGGRLNVYALNDLPKDLRTAIQAKTASDLLENLPRPRAVQFDGIPPARWHHTGTAAGKRAARKARNRRKAKR